MYVYFDKKGTLTTIIPHGETIRQGNDIHLTVCFDKDYDRFKSNITVRAKMRGEDNWSVAYTFSNPHIITFKKLFDSEMTYDLQDNTQYVAYDIKLPYATSTNVYGKGKLIINVFSNIIGTKTTLRELDETPGLQDGDIGCLDTNGIITYYVYDSSGSTVIERWIQITDDSDPTTTNFYQGLVDYYVEPTYGNEEPSTPDISDSEYDRLMQAIGSKVDIQNGIAKNIDVTKGTYHAEQDFTDANVRVKDAVDENEPVSLKQLNAVDTEHKELLDKKVDKLTPDDSISRAYMQYKGGKEGSKQVTVNNVENSIPTRDGNGNFAVGDPVEDLDVVNKQTLEREIGDLATKKALDDLHKEVIDTQTDVDNIKKVIPDNASETNKLVTEEKFANFATKEDLEDYTTKTEFEKLVKQTPTGIAINGDNEIYLEHDGEEITGQTKKVKVVSQAALDEIKELIPNEASLENPLVAKSELEGLASKEELKSYTPLTDFNKVKVLIPAEATADNLLADRSWVTSQIGTVYRYKGSVASYNDLPKDAENGDVYNVEQAHGTYPAGTNYAWNGTDWDPLGGSVDLSNYVTKTELTTTLSNYITTTALNTKLSDYVTSTALTELLESYATSTELNNEINRATEKETSLEEQIKALNQKVEDYHYVNLKINTFTGVASAYEQGSTINSLTLNWTYNKDVNPVQLTLKQGDTVKSTDKTIKTLSLTNLGIATNTQFTLSIIGDKAETSTATQQVKFMWKAYWGTASSTTLTNDQILNNLQGQLTETATREITVNALTGQYIYYVVPASFGTPSFFVGGFEGGFNLVETKTVTNASGGSTSYNIYRTTNSGLGNTTVVIKG